MHFSKFVFLILCWVTHFNHPIGAIKLVASPTLDFTGRTCVLEVTQPKIKSPLMGEDISFTVIWLGVWGRFFKLILGLWNTRDASESKNNKLKNPRGKNFRLVFKQIAGLFR